MTKTTNYEISKKLAEIGFDKETNFYFTEIAPDKFKAEYYTNNNKYFLLKSYDLETLLDALPEKIKVGIDRAPQSKFYFDKISFGYAKEPKIEFQFYCRIQKSESLADTAGRLIILLESKNLIKFKNIWECIQN
jgi:hypothetical protein